MFSVVFNPRDTPAVLDPEGRTVAARSWAPAATHLDQVSAAIDEGRLLLVPDRTGDDLDDDYVAARGRVRALNDRADRAAALSANKLAAVATELDLPADDDAVRRVALSDIDIPAGRSRSRADRDTPDEEEA